MQKPKGKKVLVKYGYDNKTWYSAEVKSLLSVQFTADVDVNGEKNIHMFYMYRDFNYTWKEIENGNTNKKV